jgi:protein-disulfide isomerase
VLEAYPKQVKLVFKQYPLSFHQHARGAALAALAAGKQGKFWEMHDKLFDNYNKLGDEKGTPRFTDFAKELGLNLKLFEAAMKDPALEAVIVKDLKDGSDARVTGTPSLYVNGKPVPGQRRNFEGLKEMIEAELAKGKPASGS